MADPAPAGLPADYFDGRSARAHRVALHIEAGHLHVEGEQVTFRRPLADVQWPERTRHGARVAHFHGGGSVQALDAAAFDAWFRRAGIGESVVVKAQQSWRGTLIAVLLLFVLAGAGYVWGVPVLTAAVLAMTPASVDRTIGDAALRSFDNVLLLPSSVPPARQAQIRDSFANALQHEPFARRAAAWELRFHTSPAATRARVPGPSSARTPSRCPAA